VRRKKKKIEKSKNKSIEVSARHTKPGDCPRQFQGNKGGTTPKICFPQLHELFLNFPCLKNFEKVERKPQKSL
jgi:hypothetical protein